MIKSVIAAAALGLAAPGFALELESVRLQDIQAQTTAAEIPVPSAPEIRNNGGGGDKIQTISCREAGDSLDITLLLRDGGIMGEDISYWGWELAPGLYDGQKLGGRPLIFKDPSNGRFLGGVGAGTDPSSDNPYTYRAAFPKEIVGRSAKKGEFSVYFEHMPNYGKYGMEPGEALAALKKDGKLKDPVSAMERWDLCWSHVEPAYGDKSAGQRSAPPKKARLDCVIKVNGNKNTVSFAVDGLGGKKPELLALGDEENPVIQGRNNKEILVMNDQPDIGADNETLELYGDGDGCSTVTISLSKASGYTRGWARETGTQFRNWYTEEVSCSVKPL